MIPVFEPQIGEDEIASVVAALRRGEISGSFGESIPKFERQFADYCGCEHAIAVSSGTAALHVAVAASDIGPGDEVLVSASTNIATALAVHHNGAAPVPVDASETDWNLDIDLVESLISPKTKAIIPVHLFGHPVEMNRLNEIARRHNLLVIEDAAEAHGAVCHGLKTGSLGDLGCFSFYANKIITTGEGGMVTTNDAGLAERLRLLRNLAFTQTRFRHELAGFNFRMTGLQAAMGLAQLDKIEQIIAEKRRVAENYTRRLSGVAGLRLPAEAAWARNVYWMYAVTVEPEFGVSRDELTEYLRANGIDTRTFFCPMNQQPCLMSHAKVVSAKCPVADRIWKTGFYLPSSTHLTEREIDTICRTVQSAATHERRHAA